MVFGLWFFNCRVTRVARGVLWVGFGVHYTTQGKFALDWTTLQVHVTFLLMRWEEGRKGGGVRTEGWRRRQDAFAGNREPTEICHCWPRGGGLFL